MPTSTHSSPQTLIWIGVWKLIQGLLLAVLASGVLFFLHRDLQSQVTHWIEAIRFDPHNRHIGALLHKLGLIDGRKMKELSGLTFVYAALFTTEGIGLLLRKRWAEYLTVVATASLLPVEIYEVCKHVNALKICLLVANLAIVVYLIFALRKRSR